MTSPDFKGSNAQESWVLRAEIRQITHQWPQILVFCLVGCLLGWGISWLWPSEIRAVRELYVGLSINGLQTGRQTGEVAGLEFNDFVDYKNWQMDNLNSLIFTDAVLTNTLNQLKNLDPYWNQVKPAQLSLMLSAFWRSAGKWRLVAHSSTPQHASQAVTAWQQSILIEVDEGITASRLAQELDIQRQAYASSLAQTLERQTALNQIHKELDGRLQKIRQLPQDRPLDETSRWLIWQTAAVFFTTPEYSRAPENSRPPQAGLGPAWLPLLDSFPSISDPASKYTAWLCQYLAAIDQEISLLQSQAGEMEAQNQELNRQYRQALDKSLGISANLVVQPIANLESEPSVNAVRPASLLMLVGGALGLIAWCASWLFRLGMRRPA